jgi:thiol-disulfide isomerase/thioredoxin
MVKRKDTMRRWTLLTLPMALLAAAPTVRDLNGALLNLFNPAGAANVLFFIASDCPISNGYAPEIQRLCAEYEGKGVRCTLLYEDVGIDPRGARKHLDEYRYRAVPAAIDADRSIANHAKATVTPEAILVDRHGEIRYRGRINNLYAALGKPRQQVTQHDLTDAINAVLTGKPVPNPETKALGCYIVSPDILK